MTARKKTDKNTKPTLAVDGASDDEVKHMTERALSIKNETSWDLPIKRNKLLAGNELDDWIENKENQHNITLVELGFAYETKKHELGHGLFDAWVKEQGKSKQTVHEARQIARLIYSLTNSNAKRTAQLAQRKQAVMARAPAELINDLLDNNEINEDMSREQIREIIDLNKKVSTLSQRLDTAEMSNIDLKKKLKNKNRLSPYPEFVETTRHESTALMDKAALCFDDLEKLYQQLEEVGRKGNAEHMRHWNIAATSLYHNLRGMVARSEKFLVELDNTLPDEVTGPVSPAHYLKETEVVAAIHERELLTEQHTHEAVLRKNQRDAKKPKGRGRPANKG